MHRCIALHFTSQSKLENDLGWEIIPQRADFLGLTIFKKINAHQTKRLVRNCMSQINLSRRNRNTNIYRSFPKTSLGFSNSFFPYFTKQFNNLQKNLAEDNDILSFKKKLKLKIKPPKIKHYSWGSKRGNALLTQLRVGRSLLNVHSFAINLADSPLCQCARLETNLHFFTECFLYTEERRLLYDSMEQILPKFKTLSNKNKLEIFLHGINLNSEETDSRNSKIIFVVQNFILKTKRF